MIEELTILSNKLKIGIRTDSDYIRQFLKEGLFQRHVIPDYSTSGSAQDCDFSIELLNSKKREVKLDLDSNNLSVKGELENTLPRGQIVYLLLYFFQLLYQKNSMFYTHAAAIEKDKRGIILVGDHLSGKTITSLKMSKDANYKVISDEGTLISAKEKPEITGGNSYMSVDKGIAEMFQLLPCSLKEDTKLTKVYIDLNKTTFAGQPPTDLVDVIFLKLDEHIKEFNQLSSLDAKVKFYLELSTDIRGVGYSLINYLYPLPSLDGDELAKTRLNFVDNLVNNSIVKFYRLIGPLEFAFDTMRSLAHHGYQTS